MLRRLTSHPKAIAQFSTSSSRLVDLSNLYSKLTGWRRKTPTASPVDPTKSSEAKRANNSMPTESKPRKLQVLGQPKQLAEEWLEVQQFAEFTAWPTNHYRKDLTKEQIASAIESMKATDFSSIESRFAVIKLVASELKLAIPDSVFTNLNSLAELEKYLHKSAVEFDERQPDAVYLNPQDFVGTNILLQDPVAERRAKKLRIRELVQKAKAAQEKTADELMAAN